MQKLCWMLGRQSYIGSAVPAAQRARASSTFGGMLRIGGVIGPAAGALAMAGNHLERVFLVDIVLVGSVNVRRVVWCLIVE